MNLPLGLVLVVWLVPLVIVAVKVIQRIRVWRQEGYIWNVLPGVCPFCWELPYWNEDDMAEWPDFCGYCGIDLRQVGDGTVEELQASGPFEDMNRLVDHLASNARFKLWGWLE